MHQTPELYGARLYGRYPFVDFLSRERLLQPDALTRPLHIVYIGAIDGPGSVHVAVMDGRDYYGVLAFDAVQAPDFMARLSEQDRALVELLALRPPRVPARVSPVRHVH